MADNQKADTPQPQKLRDLASWYREFAERAGSTTIWETRIRMAEDLDLEAARLERERVVRKPDPQPATARTRLTRANS